MYGGGASASPPEIPSSTSHLRSASPQRSATSGMWVARKYSWSNVFPSVFG